MGGVIDEPRLDGLVSMDGGTGGAGKGAGGCRCAGVDARRWAQWTNM